MPFNTNLPLKQATEVSFYLLQEIFKRIIKANRYFTINFGFIIFYLHSNLNFSFLSDCICKLNLLKQRNSINI